MKKVIEQEEAPNIIVIHKEDEIIVRENVLMQEPVTVEKSKAREVALAICPELGEPTIKTDNTKVILHLESELKEAVELVKEFDELNEANIKAGGLTVYRDRMRIKLFAFLTKHKSKE